MELPSAPTAPSCWPGATCWPSATVTELMWAYQVADLAGALTDLDQLRARPGLGAVDAHRAGVHGQDRGAARGGEVVAGVPVGPVGAVFVPVVPVGVGAGGKRHRDRPRTAGARHGGDAGAGRAGDGHVDVVKVSAGGVAGPGGVGVGAPRTGAGAVAGRPDPATPDQVGDPERGLVLLEPGRDRVTLGDAVGAGPVLNHHVDRAAGGVIRGGVACAFTDTAVGVWPEGALDAAQHQQRVRRQPVLGRSVDRCAGAGGDRCRCAAGAVGGRGGRRERRGRVGVEWETIL